ncbi:Frataxin [Piromyces finnis]|uniref:ferroxidase n=1 Tax=Piromyces finnis TaxID=1754191 RepID=A0A1Y1VLI1_9FUNG|nr:Frataxin [Piromyces finnis]|eukprot:ORX59282.1 Frataxin [Piromyces finnis]
MSFLSNISNLSLCANTGLNRAMINCVSKSCSIPTHQLSLKSLYHLNTSPLTIQNSISSQKINFNFNKTYVTKQCCIISPISVNEFHEIADEFFDNLTECIEILLENSNIENYDTELSSGVLTIKLGSAGTYVINKQTPNKQIWYSSPISGPMKFFYDPKVKRWVCTTECDSKDDSRFLEVKLSKELTQIFKKEVVIEKMNE